MLIEVGWTGDFLEKNTPVLPKSGWMEDNLPKKRTGRAGKACQSLWMLRSSLLTLYDVLDEVYTVPCRRVLISNVYKIEDVGNVFGGKEAENLKGVGDVLAGKEAFFLPTHTAPIRVPGKVFTMEMHISALRQCQTYDRKMHQ